MGSNGMSEIRGRRAGGRMGESNELGGSYGKGG
jgi:hypothetical protein